MKGDLKPSRQSRFAVGLHAANPRPEAASNRVRRGSDDRSIVQKEGGETPRGNPAAPTACTHGHRHLPFRVQRSLWRLARLRPKRYKIRAPVAAVRGDQHDLAVAGLGARPAAQQQADLLVTADQAGQSRTTQRVGETPNLAARLQALAESGTVVIAGSTRRLLGDLFEYRDLGVVEVKGLAAPVPAWRVLRTSNVASRFEAPTALAPSPRRSGRRPRPARWRSRPAPAAGRIRHQGGRPCR